MIDPTGLTRPRAVDERSAELNQRAGTDTPRGAGNENAHGSTWQREMERAQSSDWFHGATSFGGSRPTASQAIATSDATTPAARNMRRADATAEAGVAPTTWPSPTLALALERSAPANVAGALAYGMNLPGDIPTVISEMSHPLAIASATEPGTAAGSHALASAGGAIATAGEQPEGGTPMRVHLELHEDGGHLWIGAQAATQEQVAQAVDEVRRRLGENRTALASVTWNGKLWTGTSAGAYGVAARTAWNQHLEGVHDGIDR